MKKILAVLAVVATSLLYSTPAFSEQKATGLSDDYGQYKAYELNKDQCLIVAKNCSGASDTVLKRVERLNKEIDKGSSVYTPEELKGLQEQLNWIYYESGDFPAVTM
ncbi:MAG: hypothetical protein H7Y05_02085 [Steroidobacteraceae bacterium]|nr:hypothetical protein [Deltaproteobacteria bacterium]